MILIKIEKRIKQYLYIYIMINESMQNVSDTTESNLKTISGGRNKPLDNNQIPLPQTLDESTPNLLPQTPDGSPPNLLPQTPDGSPPNLLPQTPDGSPPNLLPQTPDGSPQPNAEIPDGPPPDKKQQQLDLLKQTYVDVAKRKMNRQKNIFNPIIDTIKIVLPINKIDKNLHSKMKENLKKKLELKCNKHGLIKKDSVLILNISAGGVSGCIADFIVTYQALACNPIEGMIVEASILNITKAGIRAELVNYDESPMIVFISRDHHHNNEYFKRLKEKSLINVKIIGVRYELNDKFVSVIGELYKI
jgi:DNA-directed RNA polymerase subunit E'/Rpb7